jgi:hypothetical protein
MCEEENIGSLLDPNRDLNGYSRSDVAKTMFNTLCQILDVLDLCGLPRDDVDRAIHKLQGKELEQWFEQQRQRDDAFYKPSVCSTTSKTTSRLLQEGKKE